MDGGNGKKRAQKEQEEEAGPSSAVEKAIDDEDEEAEEEDEKIEAFGGDSKNGVFVPGPLLSLKEQIERDKVLLFMIFTSFLFFNFF